MTRQHFNKSEFDKQNVILAMRKQIQNEEKKTC